MSLFEVIKIRTLSLPFRKFLLHHFITYTKNNLKETTLLVVSFFFFKQSANSQKRKS